MGEIVQDYAAGKAQLAFAGDRNSIWHRLGNAMKAGQTMDQWIEQSGLPWEAVKVPAYALVNGVYVPVPDKVFLARNDNGYILGDATPQYKVHQPREFFELMERYIGVDSRFQFDAAGYYAGGSHIWITAKFNGDMTVGGDKHKAYLLATTSFDTTAASITKTCMTRAICDNTLKAAVGEKTPTVRSTHRSAYDADRVARELADLAQQFDRFKEMGDAMASHEMPKEHVSLFFKEVLDIPFEAKPEDISTYKLNQFQELGAAYKHTVQEGTPAGTQWCALNAVTRFVDHERTARGSDGNQDMARFVSANFGTGDAMKAKAVDLLRPRVGSEAAAKWFEAASAKLAPAIDGSADAVAKLLASV